VALGLVWSKEEERVGGWASRRPRPREEHADLDGSKEFRPNLEKEGKSIRN
jgi:hypothetical protein